MSHIKQKTQQYYTNTILGEDRMRLAKYFSATWCGPCKQFKPIMEEIAGDGYSIEFIDVDNEQNKAEKYGVRSVPTVVIEDNGIEVDRFIGVLPKKQVIERLS